MNMPNDSGRDPLEGFQITGYDSETEVVTIQIDRRILAANGQQEAVLQKCKDVIERGPSVSGVTIEPRDKG